MKCPHCEAELEISLEHCGRTVECPDCGETIDVPPPLLCPYCMTRYPENRRICTECGYDFVTHEQHATVIETPPDPLLRRIIIGICDACPGLFRLSTLIGFLAACVISVLVILLGLSIFGFGVILSGGIIMVAGAYIYLQGLVWICTGYFCFLKEAFCDLSGSSWNAFVYLALTPLVLLFGVLIYLGNVLVH